MRPSVKSIDTTPAGGARRATAVLVASIAAHVAVLSTLQPNVGRMALDAPNAVDVTFVETPTPSEVQPVEPPANDASARPGPSVTPSKRPDPILLPTTTETPPNIPTPSLDPSEAARAFVLSQQGISDTDFEIEQGEASPDDPAVQDLFGSVGAKRYLTQREPPQLRRRGDGTYRYLGHAFEATVEADGSVSFADGTKKFTREGGLGSRFDVTEHYLRKRGEDPSRVEKRWFLKSTAAFRDELAERWYVKQRHRVLLKLRGRLIRISEDAALTHDQKAARVIAIFEDTGDDDNGAAARAAIVEFVEANMPTIVLLTTPGDSPGTL